MGIHEEADGNHVLFGEGCRDFAFFDGGLNWTDYTASFRVKILTGGGVQLNCRVSEPYGQDTRYMFILRENATAIDKEHPHGNYFHLISNWGGIDFALGVWHDIEVSLRGGHLEIHIDGILQLEYDDPDPHVQGTIIFETLDEPPGSGAGASYVYVDDVEVRGVAPAGQAETAAGAKGCCFGEDCENLPPDECEARGGISISTHCNANACRETPLLAVRIISVSCTGDPYDPGNWTLSVRVRVTNEGTGIYEPDQPCDQDGDILAVVYHPDGMTLDWDVISCAIKRLAPGEAKTYTLTLDVFCCYSGHSLHPGDIVEIGVLVDGGPTPYDRLCWDTRQFPIDQCP